MLAAAPEGMRLRSGRAAGAEDYLLLRAAAVEPRGGRSPFASLRFLGCVLKWALAARQVVAAETELLVGRVAGVE